MLQSIKTLSIFLLFLISFSATAQNEFEKGYFINENNTRIECLIKNYDWTGMPSKIEYKLSEDALVNTVLFDQMKAFQIYETVHYYKKFKGLIDKKTDSELDQPESGTYILKVLVDGKASLYSYDNAIFLYNIDNSDIKQLKYKNL